MKILKNRKAVMAIVLCAFLVMAIGYAALNDYLTVDGHLQSPSDAQQTIFDSNIKFKEIVSQNNCTDVELVNDDTVAIDVHTLVFKDDVATATLRIINEGNIDAVVYCPTTQMLTPTSQTTTDIADYYDVDIDWTDNQVLLGSDAAPYQTVDVTITVTLLKTIDKDVEGDFTITFQAIDKATYDANTAP
ncbi:MAG: hypothetical protein IJW21_06735 [Clostridia bacterium]|nr:hypothetical protein [Clostridia bacterium]